MKAGVRVLIVEDDAAIREISALALESAGHTVLSAESGLEALRVLERTHVDVILLDVRMPGMDGAEFVRRYRAATTKPVPIIVLTAAHDATRARDELGAARCIQKPFDIDDLFTAVAEVT